MKLRLMVEIDVPDRYLFGGLFERVIERERLLIGTATHDYIADLTICESLEKVKELIKSKMEKSE